ncbi:uncharacterized protein LOC142769241 isoform X1 [Rhipicephalus microplus]|uniref:uncharacterized protein LOC142769241 isoform X1 n=1 Tax=Rhipicephalus microplus TaxID=6941 RepID=UPI003F6C502C
MAPYSNWRWSCLLIAIVVPSNLATEQTDTTSASTTPRSGVWTWPIVFMHSKVIYLNLSTMEYPDINCIKEYRVTWNHSARLMTKMMWIGSSTGNWENYDVVYKAEGNRRPAQAFTAVDSSGSMKFTIAFNYTSEHCAIISKKQNNTGGDFNNSCELWVNDKFFKSGNENQEPCTTNFKTFCQRQNTTVFNIDNCEDSEGKPILIA